MEHGFFHDEYGDRSAARLMSFILTIAIIIMAGYVTWSEKKIPELHWVWIAFPLGFYLITKVGQPVADFFVKAIAAKFMGIEIRPEEKAVEAKP